MIWRVALCLVAVAVSVSVTRANAQMDQLLGDWQQIESNAGSCPTCRISIDGTLPSLNVTANNGWSAKIVVGEKDGVTGATGSGRWNPQTKSVSSKPFNIVFIMKGTRLYMTMFLDGANGSRQAVKGVFGRPWIGS